MQVEEREYSTVGGWLALNFTNTVQDYHGPEITYDYFQSYADLIIWARQMELITPDQERALARTAAGNAGEADEVLERARALRDAIHNVFAAVGEGDPAPVEHLQALNKEIAAAMCHARIEPTGEGFQWAWNDYPESLDSILWPVARSAADLLTSERVERVRECAGDSCGWLFMDTSKNHSRRWCDMRDCGNTAKARRHYQRKVKGIAG
jgi:predicted RNA-binding Zn ribbon-like protein